MICNISYDQCTPLWKVLWETRISPIESNSAMTLLGGYDMVNMDSTAQFFGYVLDGNIVGVNSGHLCGDNTFRSRGLYVMPQHRKRGIGVLLLQRTIESATEYEATTVWSFPKQTSWTTYNKAGFQLCSPWVASETGINAYCRLDVDQKR